MRYAENDRAQFQTWCEPVFAQGENTHSSDSFQDPTFFNREVKKPLFTLFAGSPLYPVTDTELWRTFRTWWRYEDKIHCYEYEVLGEYPNNHIKLHSTWERHSNAGVHLMSGPLKGEMDPMLLVAPQSNRPPSLMLTPDLMTGCNKKVLQRFRDD